MLSFDTLIRNFIRQELSFRFIQVADGQLCPGPGTPGAEGDAPQWPSLSQPAVLDEDMMAAGPGTYRESDQVPVQMADAKAVWADQARIVLIGVAGTYHGLINYGELAEEVQARSGIRTRMLIHYWIGDVLGRVARDCHRRGEPLLSALCVHADGTIGEGYGIAVTQTYGDAPQDLDMHADQERLKCYRHFGASILPDGGSALLTPQVASRRRTAAQRARKKTDSPPRLCPRCHLILPVTGQCDNCS
ncbi:MAG TPA: hypothetical protein VLA54_12180 [Acidimicrobiia bacterium]|nr:hypothetical protein [Acidimicrobiia bacterium]